MTGYISLAEAKAHLEVDLDYTGDDQLIEGIIEDAVAIAEADLCVPLTDIATEGKLPGAVRRAVLLLIGSFYKSREDDIPNSESGRMYNSYQRLISLHRNYAG